ncbi:TetR/AcrR family transcriptional regulator [Nocardia takedensis]
MTSTTRSADALLDAALASIAENGLDALTLSAVATRAGVSRATAYREFGDKEGLISAVGRTEVARMVAAAYTTVDLFAPIPQLSRTATLFALDYLRNHPAFGYVRAHEPGHLLALVVAEGESRLNLVETVASFAEPVVAARGDAGLALPARQAAEVVVRIVLSHVLLPGSALSDEQVADTAARAITGADSG